MDKVKIKRKQAADRTLKVLLGNEDLVARWWESPNRAFGARKPIEVWKKNPDLVAGYIVGALSGDYHRRVKW